MKRPRLVPPVLAERDFRLLFIGNAASAVGDSFKGIALVFAVLEVTGSVAAVGLVLGATQLPKALFVIVGGVVGDRLPRRVVMISADVVRFLTQATAALLLLTGQAALWHLIALFAVHGLAQAFFLPASVGLVAQVVPRDSLQQGNALLDLSRHASVVGGALVGGVVVASVGPGAAFAVDSATFLVSGIAVALLRPVGVLRTASAGAFIADLVEGWGEFRSRTWLWASVVHISLLNACAFVSFLALGPLVAIESLGGAAAWGIIAAAFASGMIAGSAIALRWRPRQPLVAGFSVVFLAAPQLVALALAAPVPVIAAAAFLGGTQGSVWSALWRTTMQQNVPATALSRVAAYDVLGSLVLVPVSFAVVGSVAAVVGIDAVLWAGAAWVVASTAAVILLPSIRAVRRDPPQPIAAPARPSVPKSV